MSKKRSLKLLCVPLALYTGLCTYLYFNQRSLMYLPQKRKLADAPLMVLQRPGAKVLVTVGEHEGPDALVYFGGNAEDVSRNLPIFERQMPNRAIYLMHYRGYGGSEGKPSENAIMGDALALFDEVAKKHQHIAVAGRSLGTGVAIRVAAQRPVSRLALITPYDSITTVASWAFWWVPVSWLLKDSYESWRYAPKISAPTLILMAEEDEVIPSTSTQRLYSLFPKGIAKLEVIPNVRHNSISSSPSYQHAFRDFMNADTP